MPFSGRSIEFLFENKLNDSKEWYEEHKDIYKEYVTAPFNALAAELAPFFHEIDSKLVCDPRRVSRVRRDTRFTKDKSLFRDHIWINVSHPKSERFEQLPSFYFCIEQTGFSLGCGYYQASTESMESIRKLVLADDPAYIKAKNAIRKASDFELFGEKYKRPKFPNESAEKQDILNRKSLCIGKSSSDFELLFSDKLADSLKRDFDKIADFYLFLAKAEDNITAKTFHHRQEDF
jgi:uncharacterized protein (TIGR02453 family)